MTTSQKQLQANRCNALKSTGPRTPVGKKTSSQNALKHGILARETLITQEGYQENEGELSTLLTRLQDHYQPQGPLEELVVQQIAGCYWRLRLCRPHASSPPTTPRLRPPARPPGALRPKIRALHILADFLRRAL